MMQLVLLGTGTPNACIHASGPSCAVIVDEQAYIVDFGPGVVRQAAKAYHNGIDALRPDKLTIAFCTHLHSDHTAGLSDLILTPWVLEREKPLQLYGPMGMQKMTDHILAAYQEDIQFRLHGFEKANPTGYKVDVTEITDGLIYEDDQVKVETFQVSHGTLPTYGYRFTHHNQTIVISGDTSPTSNILKYANHCDILLHEVEYTAGLQARTPKWQKYHQEVHTLSTDLAKIAQQTQPSLIVTTHRIYHMNMQDNSFDVLSEVQKRDNLILQEIKDAGYHGNVINGKDLDVFTIPEEKKEVS